LVESYVFGDTEEVADQLGNPVDVAVNSKQEVYILDRGFTSIWVYGQEGSSLARFGSEGDGPGDMSRPLCIAVDPRDRVYVAGDGGMITVYEADGTPVKIIKRKNVGVPVRSIRVDDSYIYTCCIDVLEQTVIHKYDKNTGDYITSFGDSYAKGKDIDTRVERVFGGGFIDLNSDGLLYFSQMAPLEVRIYERSGRLLSTHAVHEELEGPPNPDFASGNTTLTLPPIAGAIITLGNGGFVTSTILPSGGEPERHVIVDRYDHTGAVRFSATRVMKFLPRCVDGKGRLYVIEDRETPVVVRYWLDAKSGEN